MLKKPVNENYCANVVSIKSVIELEGMKTIAHTNIFGNMVIVSKEVKIGDIGIFFPIETKLSHDFLSNNNLYRHNNQNIDQTKKGFFEDNGRIRCVKFQGYKSMGFFIPLESLDFTNHKEDLVEGSSFDEINGIKICEKFLIQRRNRGNSNKTDKKVEKISRLIDNQFRLHSDTAQLGKNIHILKSDDVISITKKMHGCLQYNGQVIMADKTRKDISKIEIGEYVLGYDSESNKIIPTRVLNKFINGSTDHWLKIETDFHRSVITCTHNHKIYTKRGYIDAKDITKEDEVLVWKEGKKLSNIQKSTLLGKALGDGYIGRNKITISHKKEKFNYLQYCKKLFGTLAYDKYDERISGYGTEMIRFNTHEDPSVRFALKDYLDDNNKFIITEKLIDDINPLVLALWYMDDGSLAHHISQQDRACIAICSYSDDDIEIFKKVFIKLGFDNFTLYKGDSYKGSKEYWRVRFNASDANKLFDMIKEYVPESMQYKLPEKYRGFFKEVVFEDLGTMLYPVWRNIIKITQHVTKQQHLKVKYDIETETHNFFANNALVHNSSVVSSNILCKKALNPIEKFLKFIGVNIVDTEYDNIYSSRKVIKNAELRTNPNDYYSEDIWGIANKELKPFLQKGMTFYAEIVGYLSTGAMIQKDFDYGCEPGTHAIYIYRITYTNPDGLVYEFSAKQVQDFCKLNGLNAVPELYYGKVRDLIDYKDSEELLEFLQTTYLEKDCSMCKSKPSIPDEGVVVRVEANDLQVYKLKSFRFLEKESKSLDTGEVNIEDNEGETN